MLATAVAAVVVLWAPFVSQARGWIRATFPGHFTSIIGAIIVIAVVAAVGIALVRIRDRRATRYTALVTAVVFGVGYAIAVRTGNPEVDAVERFHFVEYGLLTFLFYRAWRPLEDPSIFVLPALAGLLVGTLDEFFQWFIPYRVGELHDILLNGAAIASGLLFSVGVDPPARFTPAVRRGSLGRLTRFSVVITIALAAFVHVVHLGSEIRDDEIGSFRSRYTAEQLSALARDRADQWRGRTIPRPPRLSREDQYMSEALWHVQQRNIKAVTGDLFTAWRENLILEKFYAPVLDTPSYLSPTGHRWPPEQRADISARVAQDVRPFAGEHVYPIYTWPKWIFWSAVAALILGLLIAGAVLDGRPADPPLPGRDIRG